LDYACCDINIGNYLAKKFDVKAKFLTNKMVLSVEHHLVFNPHLVDKRLVDKIIAIQNTTEYKEKAAAIYKKYGMAQLSYTESDLSRWLYLKARPNYPPKKTE